MHLLTCLLTLAVISLCAAERACNNSPELCTQPYDQITHLGAHSSPFLRDASTGFSSFGNHFFNTTIQLDAGVRLLSAQVHVASNAETKARELHLCHSSCELFDVGLVHKWFWEIRVWMDANPNEVVTLLLVNMDSVDAKELQAEYSKADLAHYGWVPSAASDAPVLPGGNHKVWPTIGELIDKGERLVSFVNPLVPNAENTPYLLNEFDFLWENAYDVTNPTNFTCTPDRPSNTTTVHEMRRSGRLFLMNHMLYWQQAFNIKTPDARRVEETNSWNRLGGVGNHLLECEDQLKRQPNFVLVDFFNVGPAMASVDRINGIVRPVGRRNVTTEVVEGKPRTRILADAGGAARPSTMALIVALAVMVMTDGA